MGAATDRRAFLARGIAVPPAMVMLLSTSLASPAIAASGGTVGPTPPTGGGGGGPDTYPGPGPGGGGGGGGGPSSPNINYPYFNQPAATSSSPPSGFGPVGGGGPAPMAQAAVPGGGGAPPRAVAAPKTRVRKIAMAGERG